MGWSRYPNVLDFHIAFPLDDALWLAALSGLVRVDWDSGEWTTFTEADGLSDNVLVSLTEEGEWLWIGSQGGVSRYNRSSGEWRTYTTDDGLSSNHNVHVYFDGERVWAGTNNGLSWYDPVADNWQSLFTADGVELAGTDGLLDDGDLLWVSVAPRAGSDGGLLYLDKASGEWTAVSRPAGDLPASSFTLTQSDMTLWAAPSDGLPWEYDKESGHWRLLSEIAPDGGTPGDSYRGAQFYAGALWLYAQHNGELVRYDPTTKQASYFPAEPLASLGSRGQIVGHDDVLWFAGQNGLLSFYLATGEWQWQRDGVGAAYSILGERDGALLINSDLGPGFWEPDTGRWQPLSPQEEGDRLSPDGAASEREGASLWLVELLFEGPDVEEPPHLLYFYEPDAEPQQFALAPPADWRIHQMLPQSVGNTLWFVGNRGFLSYNPAVDQWGVFELPGASLPGRYAQLGEQVVWFITDTDLGRFDTNTGTFTLAPLPVFPISQGALAAAPEALWLLADGALYWRALGGDGWTMVNSTALCLSEATQLVYWDGALWMGGAHGVGRVKPPASAWECFSPADGMLDAEFAQIFPTDDALWFSHPWYGLCRYKGQNDGRY